jgi:hypothetical protein
MVRDNFGNRVALVTALLLNAVLLSACGGGTGGTQTTQAASSTSSGTTSISATTASSTKSTTSTASPAISGTGAATVNVGSPYTFTPVVSGASGTVSFSIANQPSWASFNATTGTLSGTPSASDIGTFANITLTVTAGGASATLGAFTVTVAAAPAQNGTAVLNWVPPTQNTDGSVITNLAGYYVYYGSSPTSMTNRIQISNAGLTAYTLTGLATGTTYFAISAYEAGGAESALSNVGSKVI